MKWRNQPRIYQNVKYMAKTRGSFHWNEGIVLTRNRNYIHLYEWAIYREVYLGLTRSISWLLMPWLLTSPGHQQPWYWLCRICKSWFYLRKNFKYLCHIYVGNDIKCKYKFMCPLKNLTREGLKWPPHQAMCYYWQKTHGSFLWTAEIQIQLLFQYPFLTFTPTSSACIRFYFATCLHIGIACISWCYITATMETHVWWNFGNFALFIDKD